MLFCGLAFMALGIALCIRAGLGITPISCPPYVLSLGLILSVGQFTIAMHILLILGQKMLLGRRFGRERWLQLVLALVFGFLIDAGLWLTEWLAPAHYVAKASVLFAGNAMLAAGMCFEIKSHLILVPTDGFVQAVGERTGKPFAALKICFDISLLLVSLLCSLWLLGRVEGIREGTFISAVLVGVMVGWFRNLYKKLRGKS